MTYILFACLVIVLSALAAMRWKGLAQVNRNIRRSYLVLLSLACIIIAADSTIECISLTASRSFPQAFRGILVSIAWWLISWAVTFRQISLARKLWE